MMGTGELVSVKYVKRRATDYLRVCFRYEGEIRTHEIVNGPFDADNAALCFIAAIGKKPSDLDDPIHRFDDHIEVPVTRNGDAVAILSEFVERGREKLMKQPWFSTPAPESNETQIDIARDIHETG